MATIKMTAKQLAEIAEQSPGYSVQVIWGDKGPLNVTGIDFHRTPTGRRKRHGFVGFYLEYPQRDRQGNPGMVKNWLNFRGETVFNVVD